MSDVTSSLEAERRWTLGVPKALLGHTGWFSSWVGVWLGRDFWECDGLKHNNHGKKHNNHGKSWLKSPLERFSNKAYCRDSSCTSGLFRTYPLWPVTPLGFLGTWLPIMVPSTLPAPAFPHLVESEASRTFCMRRVTWEKSSSILYPKHAAAWYCGRSVATAPGWVTLSQWQSPHVESKKDGLHDTQVTRFLWTLWKAWVHGPSLWSHSDPVHPCSLSFSPPPTLANFSYIVLRKISNEHQNWIHFTLSTHGPTHWIPPGSLQFVSLVTTEAGSPPDAPPWGQGGIQNPFFPPEFICLTHPPCS